ncbi:MAG: haloacid dehalogenase [Alphaproteobacteria bacterium]|nr:MAG: haloacid dehalogenase [Alphaproteobacteria bacterium]
MSRNDQYLIDGVGLWSQLLSERPATAGRPCLFLDRDGVLVDEVHFLQRPADVRLAEGIAAAIAAANAAGFAVVVVTNQSGIARGLFGWEAFAAVQAEIVARLAAAGARLDAVLACAYHHDGRPPFDVADHEWRKPRPGMLLHAARLMALNLPRSVIIGDRISDLEAGRNAGLAGGTLVMTGYGRDHSPRLAAVRSDPAWASFPIAVAERPAEAVRAALAAALA